MLFFAHLLWSFSDVDLHTFEVIGGQLELGTLPFIFYWTGTGVAYICLLCTSGVGRSCRVCSLVISPVPYVHMPVKPPLETVDNVVGTLVPCDRCGAERWSLAPPYLVGGMHHFVMVRVLFCSFIPECYFYHRCQSFACTSRNSLPNRSPLVHRRCRLLIYYTSVCLR